jgi:hypothetical protein
MKTRTALQLTAVAALSVFTVSSQAHAYLIGEFETPNSGDATVNALAQDAIDAFNALGVFPAPVPDLNTANIFQAKVEGAGLSAFFGSDDQSVHWEAPSGGDVNFYVITKWGQPQGGPNQADFDTALHFVTAGNTLDYNPGGDDAPFGLSYIAIFHTDDDVFGGGPGGGRVPDGGATAALLGLGVLGLGVARRAVK